jgi:arsenite methyltransferase
MPNASLFNDTPDLADHYEHASVDRQLKAGKLLVGRIGIAPGAHVLDVGCGTGLLAEYVAGLVGPSGHVFAVDPLPLRIDIAQRKATSNLTFAVDDASGLKLCARESFDVIYLNAVFHWLSEKLEPLRNLHRLLKVGGKLGISTVSKDHPTRIQRIQEQVLSQSAYKDYLSVRVSQLHRVSADELARLLRDAGFEAVTMTIEPNSTLHANPEAALRHAEASSFGNLLGHLPLALRERARVEIATELERYLTPQGIRHEGARITAVAVKRTAA